MSSTTKQIIEMLDMLPEKEQELACEVLKRLVLAWDPDFTKLTPDEDKKLDLAMEELNSGSFVCYNEPPDKQ